MTLFRMWGIPIRLHWSFAMLGALFLVAAGLKGGLVGLLTAMSLGGVLLGSVILHELGHAAAGRAFGVQTEHVTLYPFGGVAAMRVDPRDVGAELWIALAGPVVNLIIAGLAWLGLRLGAQGMEQVILLNLGMGLFNLVPAWPMDGGRVLRALWSRARGLVPGTLGALGVSRALAYAAIAVGLWKAPVLMLLGAFLLISVRSESGRWRAMADLGATVGTSPRPRGGPGPRGHWVEASAETLARFKWEHPLPAESELRARAAA